jgi:diguanylate cyclase (GGDEF)-like protein
MERYRTSFKALFAVAKALTEELSLDDILRKIAREACHIVGAHECSIMLLDETRSRLLTAASHGLTPDEERTITFAIGEGVAGWVARNRKLVRIGNVMRDRRFRVSPHQEIRIRTIMCAPLVTKKGLIGVISATHPNRPFTKQDGEFLMLLADAIVLDVEIVRLRHLAYLDPLTGAWSRQGLDTALQVGIQKARTERSPLAAILFDVDRFKEANDRFGHRFGDAVLRGIVDRTKETTRLHDRVYRYGGDEFLLLVPGVDLRGGRAIARRVKERIAAEPFELGRRSSLITVTTGVATIRRGDPLDGSSLVERADAALLAAKRARPEGGGRRGESSEGNRETRSAE